MTQVIATWCAIDEQEATKDLEILEVFSRWTPGAKMFHGPSIPLAGLIVRKCGHEGCTWYYAADADMAEHYAEHYDACDNNEQGCWFCGILAPDFEGGAK